MSEVLVLGELSLCRRGWAEDLLHAAAFDPARSLGFALDLRHLFLRRWESELSRTGLPLLPTLPQFLSRSKALMQERTPLFLSGNDKQGVDFCFGYGASDYGYSALNYRNKFRHAGQPRHFFDKAQPLFLGNFAVNVACPAQSCPLVLPPPDLEIAGTAVVASAKSRSVFMWLGVRYCRAETDWWLLNEVENLELEAPLFHEKPLTYAYGSVFSRAFAGSKYDLTKEEEAELRLKLGYPAKGKPIRERMLYDAVCSVFGANAVIHRWRGKELEGLEIDVWVPSQRLGFEYQGQQHYQHIPHWHGEDGLSKQEERDLRKNKLCKALGITLLYFGPGDAVDRAAVVLALRQARVF